jgi:hypothetical protein
MNGSQQSKSAEEGGVTADELARLRKHTEIQARELAVLRWEIAALTRTRPGSSRLTEFKYSLLRQFPATAKRAANVMRRARGLATALGELTTGRGQMSVSPAGQTLLIDQSDVSKRFVAGLGSSDLTVVSPGGGPTRCLIVPQAGEPPLREPLDGSLADWLVKDPSRLRGFDTVVVEAGDDVSLALLRGRLTTYQRLVLTHATGVSSSLVAELGAPTSGGAGISTYSKLPVAWLDPLDEGLRPGPSISTQRSWPKISVVMVSFNQAAFLEEGIRSVLDQQYPNLEFIVIDAKSTDGSIDVLEKYRSRFSYLLIESDKGQSEGLNKGLGRATGEILTWLNSDDLLEPGALFRVAQAFEAHKVDMVVGGCRQIGLRRNDVLRNHHTRLPFGPPVALPLGLLLEMDRFWLTASFFYQPEVFFSRDIWIRSGARLRTDLHYILDYDLWVRMAAAQATIVHIPEFLACSRTHDQQKTTTGMPYLPEVQRLLQEYAGRLLAPPA